MTAAINTPGLRYRSFGNDLPRPPAALPEEAPSFPLLSDAMPQASAPAESAPPALAESPPPPVEVAAPEPVPEPPPAAEEELPFAGQSEVPPPAPVALDPVPEPEPPAPAIDWAALAAAAPVAAEPAPPTLLATAAPPAPSLLTLSEPPPPAAAPAGVPGFRLLEAIGHVPSPAVEAAPQRAGTLAMLRGGLAPADGLGDLPLLNPPSLPRRVGSDTAPGQLPAHAVTVPLAEVMRLIASGAPPVSSPFDAFRAALRSSGAP